jgi:hypothetical protein
VYSFYLKQVLDNGHFCILIVRWRICEMYVPFCCVGVIWAIEEETRKQKMRQRLLNRFSWNLLFSSLTRICQFWMNVMYTSYKHLHMFMLTSVVHTACKGLVLNPVLYSAKCYGFWDDWTEESEFTRIVHSAYFS